MFYIFLISMAIYLLCFAQSVTGRLLPNAWPSKKMIEQSLYLQKAMDRSVAAYFIDLFKFSPLQLLGMLFGVITIVAFVLYTLSELRMGTISNQKKKVSLYSKSGIKLLALASFSLWPLGFVGGLTLIGGLGGGFQIRFIVPIIPATSILASIAIESSDTMLQPVIALLLSYGGMHCLYYAVLYSPLSADMHMTIFDIIRVILESPYEAPPVSDIKFMKHFGMPLE